MSFDPTQEDYLRASEGLCPMCRNRHSCVYCQLEDNPVAECSGFELAPARRADSPIPGREPSTGLCDSCARASSCPRERPIGGVWHCEDYC